MTREMQQRVIGAVVLLLLVSILVVLFVERPKTNTAARITTYAENEQLQTMPQSAPEVNNNDTDLSAPAQQQDAASEIKVPPSSQDLNAQPQHDQLSAPSEDELNAKEKAEEAKAKEQAIQPIEPAAPSKVEPVQNKPAPVSKLKSLKKNNHHVSKRIHKTHKIYQAAKTRWAVQMASFKSIKHAKTLQRKLDKLGFASVVKRDPRTHFSRVFVGPISSKVNARNLLGQLKQVTKLSGIIAKYPVV